VTNYAHRPHILVLIGLLLFSPAIKAPFSNLYAQDSQPPKDYTLSVDVDRVALYVTVREGKTRFVGDLRKEDFTVWEDNVPQKIIEFSRNDVPVSIGLVIDNSQSMMNKRKEVVAAANSFVHASNPEDQMFVVHFNEHISFGLPDALPFTSDRAELERALDRLTTVGKTALYDAVGVSLEHLRTSRLTKKALVVISDGGDNVSQRKMQDVVKAADLSGALFFGIGIYDPMDGDADPQSLRQLGRATGGESYFPTDLTEINGLCEAIARDMRSQYTIFYEPNGCQGGDRYHRIKVRVNDPKRRKLIVRTRTGYYCTGMAAAKGPSN